MVQFNGGFSFGDANFLSQQAGFIEEVGGELANVFERSARPSRLTTDQLLGEIRKDDEIMTVRFRNLMSGAMLVASVPAPARAAPSRDPHTAAAVLAADQGWTDAEIRGDAAFVDALLLPEYQSIGTAGKITNKAAIVAGSRALGFWQNGRRL